MADSYPFNQFASHRTYEGGNYGVRESDNAEFLYPGNLIPNIYDSPVHKTLGSEDRTNTSVQRGFIRGIMPQVINENAVSGNNKTLSFLKNVVVPVRRCFFQFNPSLILRSVQTSSSTLNPLIQDPAQLVQPIPGQSSFEFQLLFNREREVAGQKYATPGREKLAKTRNGVDLSNGGIIQSDVGAIGVLHDLYVLDSIIGQSITEDLVQMVQAYWAVSSSLSNKANAGTEGWTDINLDTFGQEDFKQKLASVYGNTAFLNPMPIRIVFSSLFMVEGFVTASNVAFHKFTKNMVPTVCTVTLSVQALYIGFAKKNAYLTDQLVQQFKDIEETNVATVENAAAGSKLLDEHLHIKLSGFYQGGTDPRAAAPVPQSLNDWIKGRWVADQSNTYMGFLSGNAREFKGLHLWGDSEIQSGRGLGLKIENITLDIINLAFIKKSKLPKSLQGTGLLKYASKNIHLAPGGSRGAPDWLVGVIQVYTTDGFFGSQIPLGKIPFDEVLDSKENYSEANPYKVEWMSGHFSVYGDPGTTFFGSDDLIILVTCKVSAQTPDGTGSKYTNVSTTKVAYAEIDPTSAAEWDNFAKNSFIKPVTVK